MWDESHLRCQAWHFVCIVPLMGIPFRVMPIFMVLHAHAIYLDGALKRRAHTRGVLVKGEFSRGADRKNTSGSRSSTTKGSMKVPEFCRPPPLDSALKQT